MQRAFDVVREAIACQPRMRDRFVETTARGQRPAGVAMAFNPLRTELQEPAIDDGGFALASAIAENPSADAQHRRIVFCPRQGAAATFEGGVDPTGVKQRFRQPAIRLCFRLSYTGPLELSQATIQR